MKPTLFLCIFLLAACAPQPIQPTAPLQDRSSPTAAIETAQTEPKIETTHATLRGHDVTLAAPANWEVMTHDTGIILTESAHAFDGVGHMEGIFIHLFLPDIAALSPSAPADGFPLQVLQDVVRLPELTGTPHITPPAAFEWESHDAAYYTLHNGDGVFTLLVSAVLPNDTLVMLNLSTAEGHIPLLHEQAAIALDSVKIDGHTLHGSTLMASLPNPLPVPDDATIRNVATTNANN